MRDILNHNMLTCTILYYIHVYDNMYMYYHLNMQMYIHNVLYPVYCVLSCISCTFLYIVCYPVYVTHRAFFPWDIFFCVVTIGCSWTWKSLNFLASSFWYSYWSSPTSSPYLSNPSWHLYTSIIDQQSNHLYILTIWWTLWNISLVYDGGKSVLILEYLPEKLWQ